VHFDIFQQIISHRWLAYISETATAVKQGRIIVNNEKLLYPNLILFVETADHFIAEIYGSTESPLSLSSIKQRTTLTSAEYLFQFAVENLEQAQTSPKIQLGGQNQVIRGVFFRRSNDPAGFVKRFPFIEQWNAGFAPTGGVGPTLYFTDSFRSAFFTNCIFLNQYEKIYRAKFCDHLIIVRKSLEEPELEAGLLRELILDNGTGTANLVGIKLCGGGNLERLLLAGQFANMFLMPRIRETTIGKFLENNTTLLKTAFGVQEIISQPPLPWRAGNPDPNEESIIPDFLLRHSDGFCDICDIKTTVDTRKSITKGGHRRRRFIEVVHEGIAQLANYEDYFSFPENAMAAKEKYGVSVRNPKLILVVGSYDNAPFAEVSQASRQLKPNIEIIDYDTLNAMFIYAEP